MVPDGYLSDSELVEKDEVRNLSEEERKQFLKEKVVRIIDATNRLQIGRKTTRLVQLN